MGVTKYTEAELVERATLILADNFPGRALHKLSFLGQQAVSAAQLLAAVQQAVAEADRDAVPVTEVVAGVLRSRCSSERLDSWAEFFGLPSNRGAGLYGRNAATAATGGVGTATGGAGVVVPTGAQLVSPDGATTFELTAGFTIPQGGSVTSAAIVAVTKGPQGNLVAGTTLTWLAPPQGLSPRLVLTTGTKGGTAAEDDVDLVLRLLRRMQQPPKGGTPNDWRTWTEEATDENGISLGIARGFIFGRRNGTLSVDVVPMKAGLGTDRDPGSTVAGKLLTYLLARKVVTDNVRVVRPRFVAGEALTLLLRKARPAGSRFAWDWDDTTSPTVDTHSGTTLILTGPAPAALRQAVDTGGKPLIQLNFTSAGPLPVLARVSSYVVDSPQAGKDTLVLQAAPAFNAPNGTKVYAGSALVTPVAAAVADYVGRLGPSRASGYAPADDPWESKVTIARIVQAALDARAEDGAACVQTQDQVGTGVGVTIKVGANAATADDYEVYDNSPNQGPQVALLALVVVRQ